MAALRRCRRLCSCIRTSYDEYGDHINNCQEHSGNWQRAHNHLLACLQSLLRDAGFSTRTHNIPRVTTLGNKTIVGDLEVLGSNMGDPKMRNLIVVVSIVHEFQGNAAAPESNGVLRHQDLDRALNLRARKKVAKIRNGYLAVDHRRAFIRAIVSTSGRILRDLLRVLYILANIKTTQFFSDIGDKDNSNEAF